MNQKLVDALRNLHPTGLDGFEGLIAKLLEKLTGQHFHLAQSGTQLGRDMSASRLNSNVVAVECKRYSSNTELNERELLGELVQVAQAIPDLDLWVLVTSRDIPSQLDESLRSAAHKLNITYFSISTNDGIPSSLEILCAQAPDLVNKYLENKKTKSSIYRTLINFAKSPDFNERVEKLRQQFISPIIGYDNWQGEQKKYFLKCLQSEKESRAQFGQVINIDEVGIKLIERKSTFAKLDDWFNQWKTNSQPFVVLGEEGDGKTWSAASWLSNKLKEVKDFPPVLFLSSLNIDDNDPETLISGAIYRYFSGLTQEQWKKRLRRWVKRETNNAPLLFVVLDGINERRNEEWWRTLLEKFAVQPWFNQIAVIITSRTAYWQRHFEHLHHIQAVTYILPPYSDDELNEALAYHHLHRDDISQELLPLIRKPRYFDLMVQYRQRVEETGDVTVARLIYEDWRDRLRRKTGIPLDDNSFKSFICELALKYQEGSKYIKEQDIGNVLPLSENKLIMLEELRTGGILKSSRSSRKGYEVDEKLLIYGFGLLLVDELEETSKSKDKKLTDVIAEWLEPHAGMDIKCSICGFAALHALSLREYSKEAKIALLQTWVSSQNPEETATSNFTAYLPIDPHCYFELAEIVWADASENRWAQELLMRSFLRWCELSTIASKLRSTFERWLGFVHIEGFSWQRATQEEAKKTKKEISNRIEYQLIAGQQKQFGDYLITPIEDNGLLRLGRVAIAIISHLPQGTFVHALATGCLAEAIMDFTNKYDLFAWVFRITSKSVWVEVKEEIDKLLAIEKLFAQQAAYRLLSFEGSQEAYQLQQTLPQNLFPQNSSFDEYKKNICNSRFAWNQEECEFCINKNDTSPELIAEQIKKYCINPYFPVPNNLGERLEPLTETISIPKLRLSVWNDRDDHALDDYEPALCAYAPNAIASLVKRIALQLEEREDIGLRQVSIALEEYALIFRTQEQDIIYLVWTRLLNQAQPWSEAEKLAEAFLFRLILKTKNAEEQFKLLLERPEEAIDLMACEQSFLEINNWDIVRNKLTPDSTTKTIQRILWFISLHIKNVPQDIFVQRIFPLLKHQDYLVRSYVLKILYFLENTAALNKFINGTWSWNSNINNSENHWGSLLLCKHASSLSFAELINRVHPIYLGYAVQCRGMDKNEVSQYAEEIQRIWLFFSSTIPDLPSCSPSITVQTSILNGEDISMINLKSLLENHSQSLTYSSSDACWGGLDKSDYSQESQFFQEMLSPNHEQQRQLKRQTVQEIIKQQTEVGNVWFAECFFSYALNQIIDERPDLVNQWLKVVFEGNSNGKKHLSLASSFYEALCAVLLKVYHKKSICLYWRIQEIEARIHVRDEYLEVELLDYAFFQAPPNEDIKNAWSKKLEQCKTDKELLIIAILAQLGNGRDWLWDKIKQGIASPATLEKSYAITLLAFIQEREALKHLNLCLENQPDTWVKNLLERSRQIWQRNDWAMHWFRRFLELDDDVTAWASFRLFLRCVDNRFWYWRKLLEAGVTANQFIDKRHNFLEDNLGTIKNKIRKNEEGLEKEFLGHKILQDQAYPWM
jgi:hypothetical protein